MASEGSDKAGVVGNDISELPPDKLIRILQKAFHTKAVPDITTKRIDEGAGFMGIIARITIRWPDGIDLPNRTIIKVPTHKKLAEQFDKLDSSQVSDINAMYSLFIDFHNREVNAYGLLAPKYNNKSSRKVNIQMPLLYDSELASTTTTGYLLMEDLGDKAYVPDFMETLSIAQLNPVMEWLGRYHAYTTLHMDDWIETFHAIEEGFFQDYVRSFMAAGTGLRKMYPDIFDASDEEIASLVDVQALTRYAQSEKYVGKVLVHGDMWTNNFFYALKKNQDGPSEKDELLAVIDWQITHPGQLGEDLCRLTLFSMSPALRRANEDQLLDVYYESFQSAVIAEGKPVPFTRHQLGQLYREPSVFGFCAFGIMGHTALMLQSAYASEPVQRKRNLVRRAAAAVHDALIVNGRRTK